MKTAIKKIKIIPILVLVFICAFSSIVLGYDDALFNKTEIKNTYTVTARISTMGMEDINYSCEYSDSFFSLPADQYNHQFARLSMGLASAAGRDKVRPFFQDDNMIDFFEQMGFKNIETDTYNTSPTADSIAYGIACKEIEGFTVISVGVCGHNYTKEWASNLKVGDGVRHEGFNEAAMQVEEGIKNYIEEHNITGKKKVWISGFSRAAATSNITAADLTASGEYEAVYAYCFATPRTTMEPGDFTNIFNIIGKDDVVPKVPLADWGYKRYGIDLYTKTQEADSTYVYTQEGLYTSYYAITGQYPYFNPELTFQFRTIFDYLVMLMPTATDYKERLQPEILAIMDKANEDNVIQIAIQAISNLTPEDPEEQMEILELLDYLQLLLNQYVLQGNQDQIDKGYWDPNIGVGYNLFTEHNPYKYMAWLNSSDNPQDIYSENTEYTRLTIIGRKLHVDLYDVKGYVGTVDESSYLGDEKGDYAVFNRYINGELCPIPLIEYSEEKIVISLPRDNEWNIEFTSELEQDITYTAFVYNNETAHAKMSKLYGINAVPNTKYNIKLYSEGEAIDEQNSSFTYASEEWAERYSPSAVMRLETINVFHLTISEILAIFFVLICIVVLELFISIILAIIRVIRKKKRHAVFTMGIHIFNICIFFLLEVCAWALAPAIPVVQIGVKIIIALIILSLGLKGYKKYKEKYKIYLCELSMLMIAIDIALEAFVIPKGSSGKWWATFILYLLAVVFACFMWKKPKIVQVNPRHIKDTKAGRKARREAKRLKFKDKFDNKIDDIQDAIEDKKEKIETKQDLKELGKDLQNQFDDDPNT